MIRQIRDSIFRIRHYYADPVEHQRARVLLGLIYTVIIVSPLIGLISIVRPDLLTLDRVTAFATFAVVPIFLFVYWALQTGRLMIASWITILFVSAFALQRPAVGLINFNAMMVLMPIIIASLLVNWYGVITVAIISLLAMSTGAIRDAQITQPFIIENPGINSRGTLFSSLAILPTATIFLAILGNSLSNTIRTMIRNRENLKDALISATEVQNDELEAITQALITLRNNLSYNLAQVHLLDVNKQISQRIVSRLGREVTVLDERSPLNEAMTEALNTKQTVAIDRRDGELWYSHFAEGSQNGLLAPLVIDGEVIGLLDVQSDDELVNEETIGLLARQLSYSIAQLRIIIDLRTELNQQQATIARQRSRLREYQRSEQQIVSTSWSAYLERRGKGVIGYDLKANTQDLQIADDLPDTLRGVLQTGELEVKTEGDLQHISVPIILRGRVLGAMTFQLPAQQPISTRQQELISNVVQRLGLALENKRLLEQSQAQAERESKANAVGGMLLSTTDVQTVLEIAADQFNDALGAIQTRIQLQLASQPEKEKMQ